MSPANERDVVAAKLKEAQDGAARQPAAEVGPNNKAATAAALPSSQTDRPSDRGESTASSSSQQDTSKVVEDGHVSDADSDSVEEIPATTVAPQRGGARQSTPSMPAAPFGLPPGTDPAQMQNMMRDPVMMKQMTDMMANMDPGQVESMARMAGAPGAAIHFSVDTSQLVALHCDVFGHVTPGSLMCQVQDGSDQLRANSMAGSPSIAWYQCICSDLL